MPDLITITFINRSAGQTEELLVERQSAHLITRWYGGYHGGDDYDVLIDGINVTCDIDGEIDSL